MFDTSFSSKLLLIIHALLSTASRFQRFKKKEKENSKIPTTPADVTKSRCAAFSIAAQSVKVREAERNEKKKKKERGFATSTCSREKAVEWWRKEEEGGGPRWGQDAFQSAVTRGCQRGASNRAFGESGAGTRLCLISASFAVINVA